MVGTAKTFDDMYSPPSPAGPLQIDDAAKSHNKFGVPGAATNSIPYIGDDAGEPVAEVVAPGTEGQFLGYGSGGVPQAVDAPGGSMSLLHSQDVSNVSQVDFYQKAAANLFTTDYDEYVLKVPNLTVSVDAQLQALVSTDGATFDTGASDYSYVSRRMAVGFSSLFIASSAGLAHMALSSQVDLEATSDIDAAYELRIIQPANASRHTMVRILGFADFTGGFLTELTGVGIRDANQADIAFRLQPSAGTMSGNFQLFGVNK